MIEKKISAIGFIPASRTRRGLARIATGTSVADGASYTFLHSPWAGTCKSASMLKFLGAYALAKVLGFGLLGAIVIYLLIR